mgnify:CR=1 FL=1
MTQLSIEKIKHKKIPKTSTPPFDKSQRIFKHKNFVQKLLNGYHKEDLHIEELGEVDIELYIHCKVKEHITNLENDRTYKFYEIGVILEDVLEVIKVLNEKPKLKEYDKIINGGLDYLYKIRKTNLKDMRLLIDETI